MIVKKPLFNGTVDVSGGVGAIPLSGPEFERLIGSAQLAFFVKESSASLELVYEPSDAYGHTIPVVTADGADFPVGSWRWGGQGVQVPLTLKSSVDQTVRMLIVEVES